jgi:hypothetical protein
MAEFAPPPAFLAQGTFQWSRRGYFYSAPPSEDLRSAKALDSSDPWIALAARLEYAKVGQCEPLRDLPTRATENVSRIYAHACMSLFGDAARDTDLELLRPRFTSGSSESCFEGCWAAYCSGELRLVPNVLSGLSRLHPNDRESVCYWMCDLLEPTEDAPLRDAVGIDLNDWLPMAQVAFQTVRDHVGSDRVAVWRGKPLSVYALVTEMQSFLSQIHHEPGSSGLFIALRHRFEAATGTDCGSFFKDGRLQPLAAAVVVEEFLNSPSSGTYQAGARYFFRHRVPN